jgi:hypothetical protein
VATGKHEYIFWKFLAFGAGLRLIHGIQINQLYKKQSGVGDLLLQLDHPIVVYTDLLAYLLQATDILRTFDWTAVFAAEGEQFLLLFD